MTDTTVAQRQFVAIDPGTAVGWTALTVANLERSTRFYTEVLGFQRLGGTAGTAVLGAAGDGPYSLCEPVADADRPGPLAPAPSRGRLAAGRRGRPPGQRGAVPPRSRRQRHRDLPRPAALRVALAERYGGNGVRSDRP